MGTVPVRTVIVPYVYHTSTVRTLLSTQYRYSTEYVGTLQSARTVRVSTGTRTVQVLVVLRRTVALLYEYRAHMLLVLYCNKRRSHARVESGCGDADWRLETRREGHIHLK